MLTRGQVYTGKNLEVLTLPVGQMQANCYFVADKKTSNCLIIDPGDDAEYIESIISSLNLRPIKIISTHGHFDHCGAVLELQLAYNTVFAISRNDEFLLDNNQASAKYFIGYDIGPKPKIQNYIKNNDKIKIGNKQLLVIETPGHTPGSICLYSKEENILFTGDLVFEGGGVGRTDFSYSSNLELKKSLHKICKLSKDTIIFPGHGERLTVSTLAAI